MIHTNDLDEFVAECDRLGGIQSKGAVDYLSDFSLRISTRVDDSLDPFSDAYADMQFQLYKELSSRELDQKTGELMPVDVQHHAKAANPYASKNVNFIAKHSRAILSTLLVSDLPDDAKILDMGCGWGLSTEIMAFCGARVHAVDINPLFVDLVRRRTERKGYDVAVSNEQFDTFTSDTLFDLAIFYECLHHSIKPWETIQRLSKYIAPTGKIAFAGEPVGDAQWKTWGLRLDSLSVYCIRKFGWFENGWSAEFIDQCFSRAGFNLTLIPNIGLDGKFIGLAAFSGEQSPAFADADRGQEYYDLIQRNAQLEKAYDMLLNSRWQRLRKALNFIKPFRNPLI